ncbi:MAG: GTPase [Oscillatoria sp. PMC 1068.18]|nr:GTPase [Oscillatoria sp. PMC 1076.18]MEC4989668.1 GTPase [Oscillatoria sp. PMC 1068.18]
MVRLKPWQWVVLGLPIAAIALFLLISAGMQIHQWGINWIWAIFIVVFAGWRWLLVKWTRPAIAEVESVMAQVNADLEAAETASLAGDEATQQAELALQKVIQATTDDAPIWEDWQTFWQRCQDLVVAIAHIYHPEVKYPLLSIYIPQAYTLIRGTVDDLDRWMQQISPVLNQVTVGQAYQAYEVYRKLEPSARKLWKVWNWAQWLVNPVVAVTKVASQPANNQATQQLLANLSQMLREAALRNLSRQAIALYSGTTPNLTENSPPTNSTPTLPKAKTKTLQEIIAQAEPIEQVKQKPVSILLAGRTGSGKSSLINTLFQADRAEVDVLPSTDRIQNYHWETPTGETLTLWDTPGYEQVNHGELRDLVLDYLTNADLLLLLTPALDPALQMDVDFLQDLQEEVADLPIITIVTQVDRLRPIREWEPPYNWQTGTLPKEKSIREATEYRAERLQEFSNLIIPVVTFDSKINRNSWNINSLSLALINHLDPAKQLRLARFLRNQESRTVAAAKIIDRYTFQMSTTQGLTALLKSPILRFLSTISTGSPALAYALAEQIPVEQLPVVIGKLQMAYDLFQLLSPDNSNIRNFDLLSLWSLLLENSASPEKNAWAFGHALVEFWTQDLSIEKLESRFQYYLEQA